MKRIGIDARLYFQTGVGTYVRNLLHYLQELDTTDTEFYIYVMSGDVKKIELTAKNFILRPVTYKWHSLNEQIGFALDLYKDKLDLMHFTYFSHPILYRKKFISSIHDATLIHSKTGKASTRNIFYYEIKHWAFKLALAHQVKGSAAIITPTKTVKNQIVELYGNKYADKIYPIYEGVDYQLMQTQENKELSTKFKKPFLMYVGNFYPHKNVERLLAAFASVKEDIQLVLIGPQNYFSDRIVQLIRQDNRLENRVIFYPNASNRDLVYFYKHARAYIQPSLSEGFGLPLVEAMYFGCSVVASNIEVFQELLGKNCTYFDPYSIQEMRCVIEENIKKPISTRITPLIFSFKIMSEEIYSIYIKSL